MVCALATTLNSVIQSIRDLQVRVETLIPEITLPEDMTTLCADGGGQGLLPALYFAVLSFVLEAEDDVTETVARPREPECYTGAYLFDMESWVDGIEIEASDICSLNLDSSGGDEGYDETFNAGNGGYTIELTYETFFQKDRIIMYSQTEAVLFDSGCVGTQGDVVEEIPIAEGITSIRVVVEPNCEGGSGTAWNLSIRCI